MGVSPGKVLGNSVPDRGSSKLKDSDVKIKLLGLRDASKASVAGA